MGLLPLPHCQMTWQERSVGIRRQMLGAARDGGGGMRRRGGMIMGVIRPGEQTKQGLVPAHLRSVPL
jgi:hypothetical protein